MKTYSTDRTNFILPPPFQIDAIPNSRGGEHPTCKFCGLAFQKNIDLRNHMEEEDWQEYIKSKYRGFYTCVECCKFFQTEKAFMQHKGKEHDHGKKTSECVVCGKMFKNRHAVNLHIKQVHEKSTRINCTYCGKELYKKYVLPEHLKVCDAFAAYQG